MDACSLASKVTAFNPEVIRRWGETVFREYFSTTANIDDVDDEALEAELMSSRGKHPKRQSLNHNERFKLEATEHVREHGYIKGAGRLCSLGVGGVGCGNLRGNCESEMGFSYRQFSKGIFFDGHEREDVVQNILRHYPHSSTGCSLHQLNFLTLLFPHCNPSLECSTTSPLFMPMLTNLFIGQMVQTRP